MCATEKQGRRQMKQQDHESSDEYPEDTIVEDAVVEKAVVENAVVEDAMVEDAMVEDTIVEEDEKEPQLQDVLIKESDASITEEELEDDQTELWLISVPRHDSVRATLPGSKLRFPKPQSRNAPSAPSKKRVGVLRGSYVYREHGPPQNGNMRAVFVVNDDAGRSSLKIAKPFSKTISVAFDTEMDDGDHDAPVKKYPDMPHGLSLKYFPIGSKKRFYPKKDRTAGVTLGARPQPHSEDTNGNK